MKKNKIWLMPLSLCLLLCSCAPMRSNSQLAASSLAPSSALSSAVEKNAGSEASSEISSGSSAAEPVSAGELGTVQIDPRDVGTFKYHVLKMRYGENLEELGISQEKTADWDPEVQDSGVVLLTMKLENVDYPMDEPGLAEDGYILVNSLNLYPTEAIDQNKTPEHIVDGALDYSNVPVYFDRAPQEEKKYFALPMPEPGQSSEEFQVAWALSAQYAGLFREDKLELVLTAAPLEYGTNEVCRAKLRYADAVQGEE